jgi:hypothetical protein
VGYKNAKIFSGGRAQKLALFLMVSVGFHSASCQEKKRCEKRTERFVSWYTDFRDFIRNNYYGEFYGDLVSATHPYPKVSNDLENSNKRIEVELYPGWIQYSTCIFTKEEYFKQDLEESLEIEVYNLTKENDDLYVLLFVDNEVRWDVFIAVVSAIVDAEIENIELVFEGDRNSIRPPESELAKTLRREKEKLVKAAIEKRQHYIFMSFEKIGHYLPGCPELESFFDELGSPGVFGMGVYIEIELPKIIRRCNCKPPVEDIKSVLWHYYYWGKSRVGLRIKLCLESCSKCKTVALHDDVPWDSAAKSIMKEHASSPESPFCFTSVEESGEKE